MDPTAGVEIPYEDHELVQAGDGAELYYESYGSTEDGAPVVTTINNFYLLAQIWRGFSTQLAQRNRVIAWDLRNQGGSKPGSVPLTWDHLVEDLASLLDHLKVERTYLLGSSISCFIARDFALRYPDRVAGCVMQAPAFSPYGSAPPRDDHQGLAADPGRVRHRRALAAHVRRGVLRADPGDHGRGGLPGPAADVQHGAPQGPAARVHRAVAAGRGRAGAAAPADLPGAAPGRRRRLHVEPVPGGRTRSALLQRGKLDVIPRAGHVATMENPHEFEASVQRFVDEVEAGTR